jgi:outer membrane usher protein
VQDSYALIRVPGVGGVHGTMSNQVMGTTDGKGDLLIPSLLHYYGNRIGIDDRDIPLDHDIGATERVIAPPYRGGVVVSFPVRRVQSVSGTVVIEDQGVTTLPTYGQIVVLVDQQRAVSPLDEAGNFYLENVPPGSYSAEVQYAAGVCTLPLDVPAVSAALVNVGTIRCILAKKETKLAAYAGWYRSPCWVQRWSSVVAPRQLKAVPSQPHRWPSGSTTCSTRLRSPPPAARRTNAFGWHSQELCT